MPYINRFVILGVLLVSLSSYAQDNFESLGESSFALDYKVSNNYSFISAARTRYYLYKDSDLTIENRQIDLIHLSTLKLNYNHSLRLGLLYRFRDLFNDGSNELRFSQQFSYTKQNMALRFTHTFSFEQRLFEDFTILRTRYRFGLDTPLSGEKLDVGESYLVVSMEALLSQSQKIKPEIDHRTTAQIGWLLTERLKIQVGFEYRFEAFNIETEEKLFVLTSASIKI
jgi:hypothetical protein